jgi:hypothetical protein
MTPRHGLWLLCLALLPACAAPPPAATLEQLIGQARCDNPSQCRTIGVGAKACGGPAAYRAWSTRDTDEAALRAWVEQDARAQREALARAGRRSDCALTPDPGAVCKARDPDGVKTCQLGGAATARPD